MSLNGKHALITGASRGIGRGIALKLAESGVKVAIHYYQNENAAKQTLEEIRKRGSDGMLVQADVTRPEQITRMLGQVKSAFGKLDIFVSNARPEAAAFFYPPDGHHARTVGCGVRFAGQGVPRRGSGGGCPHGGREGESSRSPTPRAAVQAGCNRG